MSEFIIDSAVIRDPTGLHARPAVKVSKLAKKFVSTVEISNAEQGVWVNAKSTNAVMKMKATHGSNLFVRASGKDASSAVADIIELIQRDFKDS
jgi:phosphocarrier protein HPr